MDSDINEYSNDRIISMSDLIPFIVLGVYWYFCYKVFGVQVVERRLILVYDTSGDERYEEEKKI